MIAFVHGMAVDMTESFRWLGDWLQIYTGAIEISYGRTQCESARSGCDLSAAGVNAGGCAWRMQDELRFAIFSMMPLLRSRSASYDMVGKAVMQL